MKSTALRDTTRTADARNGIAEDRIVLRIVREGLRSESPRVRFVPKGAAA
jgi:hypothetical protein